MMARLLTAHTQTGEIAVADPAFAAEQFCMLCQAGTVMRTRLGLPVGAQDAARAVDEAVRVFFARLQHSLRKQFFSEEKNQKTFARLSRTRA